MSTLSETLVGDWLPGAPTGPRIPIRGCVRYFAAIESSDNTDADRLVLAAEERRAIDAVRNGNSDAFDVIVARYSRRVHSIAWGIVRNRAEAEDLAQEAFVRAYRQIGRFRGDRPFGPWIFRIVTNLAIDVVRRRSRHPETTVGDEALELRDLSPEWNDLQRRIDSAIDSLPEMQRVVARLYLVEGFSHDEIAGMTDLTVGTIRSHLSHARKKLQNQLRDLYYSR